MEVAKVGNSWPFMLGINVGNMLVLSILSRFGLKAAGLCVTAAILVFNHYASRHLLLKREMRHFAGVGLLGMISLVAVSSGGKLPLAIVPFSSAVGVLLVLMLLNVFPPSSTERAGKAGTKIAS